MIKYSIRRFFLIFYDNIQENIVNKIKTKNKKPHPTVATFPIFNRKNGERIKFDNPSTHTHDYLFLDVSSVETDTSCVCHRRKYRVIKLELVA